MADLGWCRTHNLPSDDDSSFCNVCRAKMEAAGYAKQRAHEDALRAEGREEERRDVVALLESRPSHRPLDIAEAIRAGEHIGAAAKEGK